MEFRVCCWSILGCVLFVYTCGPGVASVTTEPTTSSAIERKTCGNETKRYYCHNGCCLNEDKDEECCYLMQVSDWCPLLNASDIYCKWGCCYHDKDEICCNFLMMQYSFLLIIAAILVSFFVFVVVVSFISKCLSCSFCEPSYNGHNLSNSFVNPEQDLVPIRLEKTFATQHKSTSAHDLVDKTITTKYCFVAKYT